ncbi:MAG TPA: hypothetical protein DC049_03205, partial [Spirochaetia bacterium]|nr:hypothetical protein [Spirochaetia bacterium]
MCKKFDVARKTVRKSIANLAAKKYIRTMPGLGSYVCSEHNARIIYKFGIIYYSIVNKNKNDYYQHDVSSGIRRFDPGAVIINWIEMTIQDLHYFLADSSLDGVILIS